MHEFTPNAQLILLILFIDFQPLNYLFNLDTGVHLLFLLLSLITDVYCRGYRVETWKKRDNNVVMQLWSLFLLREAHKKRLRKQFINRQEKAKCEQT